MVDTPNSEMEHENWNKSHNDEFAKLIEYFH